MKGFTPPLSQKNTETSSKNINKFIELGVKQESHQENCDCEECIQK